MTKKIKLKDVTQQQLKEAQQIVHNIIAMQSAPGHSLMGRYALRLLLKNKGGLRNGLDDDLYDGLDDGLHEGLRNGLHFGLDFGLDFGLYNGLYNGLRNGLDFGLHNGLYNGLRNGLDNKKIKLAYCGVFWSWWLARYMIAYKWGCPLDKDKLALLHAFCCHCPIILYYEKDGKQFPIICPKPQIIKWNYLGLTTGQTPLPIYELHADGEPAVEIKGLIKLYYHHNIKLPEKYGAVKCEDWNPEWWITETNAEYRRLLAEVIGYDKIALKLELEEKHKWRGYTLVRTERNDIMQAEGEPLQLLKMTCPSTGHVHFSRVDPEIQSAEVAATVLNAGIHPDLFNGAET